MHYELYYWTGSRVAANSCDWRWRMPAPAMPTWRATRATTRSCVFSMASTKARCRSRRPSSRRAGWSSRKPRTSCSTSARRLGLVPEAEGRRLYAHQLQLTISDLVAEVHDAHHPIASSLYYEDQRTEATRRAADLRETRLPKYLDYFEQVLERGGGLHALREHSYVDLSLFQLMSGLDYAFPRAMQRIGRELPLLRALKQRVAERPRLAAYLASPRRLPFNEAGIFRHYPELDDPA